MFSNKHRCVATVCPGVTALPFAEGVATAEVQNGDVVAVFSTASETEKNYSYRIQQELTDSAGEPAKTTEPSLVLEPFPKLAHTSSPSHSTDTSKPAAKLGSKEQFWTWDLSDLSVSEIPYVEVTAILKASGKYCDVYVDENSQISTADAEEIAKQFDTVAYPIVTHYFGEPPAPNGNARVTLLLPLAFNGGLDDEPNPQGFAWGAFNDSDQTPPGDENKFSNYRNILYLNPGGINTTNPDFIDKWRSILSHEFQHLLHYRYHQAREPIAVDEGKSMLAELLSGYGLVNGDILMWANIDQYQQDPAKISLLQMAYEPENGLATYGMGVLWATYLFDRFGEDTFLKIATSPTPGVPGAAAIVGTTPEKLFTQWVQANIVNGLVDDAAFGYRRIALSGDGGGTYYEPLLGFAARSEQQLPSDETKRTVPSYGVEYFRASADGQLTIRGKNIHALIISSAAQ